jgi:signal transduction histidine kinase
MEALVGITALLVLAVLSIELLRLVGNARRAVRIHRALHELRRPLHSIGLALQGASRDVRGAEACLEQARHALADLEAVVDGRRLGPERVRVAISDLARGLEDRWHMADVRVDPPPCGEAVEADPGRLGAALDNLVANALRHGSGPVHVRTLTAPGVARFEVRDGGPAEATPAAAAAAPRHGHGLAVAATVAASHGGSLAPPRRSAEGGTVAALSLPTVTRDVD